MRGRERAASPAADVRALFDRLVELLGLLVQLVAPVAPRVVDRFHERTNPGMPWRSSGGK